MEQKDRSRPRSKRLLAAELRSSDEAPRKVVVRDISAAGLMGEMGAPPAADEAIEVRLGELGWVPGKVVWSREGKFAIQFAAEINPAGIKKIKVKPRPYQAPPRRKPVL